MSWMNAGGNGQPAPPFPLPPPPPSTLNQHQIQHRTPAKAKRQWLEYHCRQSEASPQCRGNGRAPGPAGWGLGEMDGGQVRGMPVLDQPTVNKGQVEWVRGQRILRAAEDDVGEGATGWAGVGTRVGWYGRLTPVPIPAQALQCLPVGLLVLGVRRQGGCRQRATRWDRGAPLGWGKGCRRCRAGGFGHGGHPLACGVQGNGETVPDGRNWSVGRHSTGRGRRHPAAQTIV